MELGLGVGEMVGVRMVVTVFLFDVVCGVFDVVFACRMLIGLY